LITSMVEKNRRSSHLWKRRNDVEAVPDKGFVRQLKMLHPSFEVVWDKGSHVWEIWDFPENLEPYSVMRVQTKNKTYRELGTDVLLSLQQNIFFHNNFTAKQICDYLDEMDNQVMRRKERDMRNHIQSIARDTFLYTQGVMQIQVPRTLKIERTVGNA
jgi:hypothetical protein